MSNPASPVLPSWAREVIDLYESGASGQFILHGNVDDCLLLPVIGAQRAQAWAERLADFAELQDLSAALTP